jgi:hypothetical protein
MPGLSKSFCDSPRKLCRFPRKTRYGYIQVLRGWGVQDVVQPYPYSITDDIDKVPFADYLYALPQLFHLSPTG